MKYSVSGKPSDSKKLINYFFEKELKSCRFFTPKRIEFLIWRYVNNPMQTYIVIFDKEYFIAGYVKKRGKLNEFRIVEVIISDRGEKQTRLAILEMANTSGANVLSISPNSGISFKTGLTGNFGPVLTFKNISLGKAEKQELLILSTWSYSLGDLELF